MSPYDVILKRVDPEWVLTCTEELVDLSEIRSAHGRLWPRLHAALQAHEVAFKPPSIAIEQGQDPILSTAALVVPDDFQLEQDGLVTQRLPGLERAASTVIDGDPNFAEGFQALKTWAQEAGEVELEHYREVYLDCDGPPRTWVVELQIGLRNRPAT